MNDTLNTNTAKTEKIDPIDFSKVDVLINGKKVNLADISKLKIKRFYPTNTKEELDNFLNNIQIENLENADDETKYAYLLAKTLVELTNNDNIGVKPNNDKIVNRISYNDSGLGIQELAGNKKAKTSKAALFKLNKAAGIGSYIQIPLYHSGFWITIRPLTNLEIINLALDLSNEITKMSRTTLGTMHTLFNLPFINASMKYISDAIIATTLQIDEEEDIFDYINVNDIYTLLWGVAKSFYPNGHNVTISCKNSGIIDETTNLPKCTYKENIHVDLEKLLWIDRSILTSEQIVHMAKRRPKSVTKKEVETYLESLPSNEEITFTLQGDDDINITVTLASPNINRYVDMGDFIVSELQEEFNEVIRKSNVNLKDEDKIDAIKDKILTTVYLKGYSHIVKHIKIDDAILEDNASIAEALEVISSSQKLSEKTKENLKTFLNKSLITTIGVPNFTCPKCGGKVGEDTIIPLAVYEYYFLLVSSRYDAIMAKQTGTK